MDAAWPGSGTRLRTAILELWGVWISLAAAVVLILVTRHLAPDGSLAERTLRDRAILSVLALFVQPLWVNVPWIFLLGRRARPLVDPGLRTDLYLASVPAKDVLRRAFVRPILRCAVSCLAGTMIWLCIFVIALRGRGGLNYWQEFVGLAVIALPLAAEQVAAFALVVLATADVMARRLLPGRAASATLGPGLYALGMIVGPPAFAALAAWLSDYRGEEGLYVFVVVAWAFSFVLTRLAWRRVRTVLERFYQFE